MPGKNIHHDIVVAALIADGWRITHDPLFLAFGGRKVFIDLAADRAVVGAERDGERIAVEVQSFLGDSNIENLRHAVGQYQVYRVLLEELKEDRDLYLAVSEPVYDGIMSERLGQLVVEKLSIRVVVFDPFAKDRAVEKLERYRQIARALVEEYARHKPANGEIDSYPVIDPVGDHYLAVQAGWDRHHRVQGAFVHLDIINGKIWVQYDGTDQPVAQELVAAGVPKDDIVLADKPAYIRPHTGYAVG